MTIIKKWALVLLACILTYYIPSTILCEQDTPNNQAGSSSKYHDAVEAFDTINLPNITGKKFVIYNSGEWSILEKKGEKKLIFQYVFGWLLSETKIEITVLENNLQTTTYTLKYAFPSEWNSYKSQHPQDKPLPGYYKELDFAKFCDDFIKVGVREDFSDLDHFARGGFPHAVEAALYAYWASQLKMDDIPTSLVKLAEESFNKYNQPRNNSETLSESVASNVATNLRWKTINDANSGLLRPELLKRWQLVASLHKNEFTDEAKQMIILYEELIKEDEKWLEPTREELDTMKAEDKVKYWVYKIRECDAQQFMQPGSVSVFGHFREKKVLNPADELVKLGMEAIPELIGRFDDTHPTRCMGFWRNFAPSSFYLLRYGDCCQQIFEKITGVTLYQSTTTSGAMVKDGKASGCKQAAQKWWAEFQNKGEKQTLIEATIVGNRDSPEQAKKLKEKYPDIALDYIIQGIQKANESWVRSALVNIVASINGEDSVKFLLEELNKGPFLRSRVAAAKGLLNRNHPNAIPAMIKEWQGLNMTQENKFVSRFDDESLGIISFLANCDSSEAIKVLAKDLIKHSLNRRNAVVSAFSKGGNFTIMSFDGAGVAPDKEKKEPSKEVSFAIEELLIASLDDTNEELSMSGSFGGKSFSNPRICDMAGHILSERWPKKYNFDISISSQKRNKQIVELKNTWRKEHDIPLLAMPQPKIIQRVPDEKIQPLLKWVKEAKTEADMKKMLTEIELLGLPALEAVNEELSILSPDHKSFYELSLLAKRLSCIVSEIVIAPDSIQPVASFKEVLDDLRNKPLTSESFIGILIYFTNNQPQGSCSIKLIAERTGEVTGVTLTVCLLATHIPKSGTQSGWDSGSSVRVGNRNVLSSSCSSNYEYGRKTEDYKDLDEAIDDAIQSLVNEAFTIRVRITESK